jgi:hypothetical protein
MKKGTVPADLASLNSIDILDLAAKLQITTAQGHEYLRYALANAQLFDRKHHDYGPNNIAKFGVFGCIIRMSDKIERIATLFKANRKARVNESVEDNIRDVHIYANIALMFQDGKWGK